ncbi:major facilitator superfamily domain-containing protein [Leucosporidium creatinivorum]|uniref:Major facilitator superfamily domain-containing protein n=1 Tax=Leucosporidium creatinivorum TaxID=106004 RepID=A0A1Y2G5J3_9BASI|nr:major facilitator superfamily domain-containing protein [Leucosporidium creatinivorum]
MSSTAPDVAYAAPRKPRFFRSVLWNALVVGIGAFLAPGLYNAMSSTGAGGAQTPYLVQAGNSILSALLFLTCFLAPMVSNRIGVKWTFVVGTTGYVVYSASLYQNNRYGTEWFIYLGSALCGLSAGLFWCAEGSIMIAYPEPHTRGRYLSMWLAFRNSGSLLGGSINLAFNATGKTTGKLNYKTFIVFVALQATAPFAAMLLTPPEKVEREDGKKVNMGPKISTWDEIKASSRLLITKRSLLMLPLFWYATFPLSYAGNYLTLYFSTRSRALASLVAAIVQIIGNVIFGCFLDWQRISVNARGRYAYIFMMALAGGTWVYAAVVQTEFSSAAVPPALDWDDKGWARAWVLYILIQLNFSIIYNHAFWTVGGLAKHPSEIIRFTSIVRGVEAAGGAVAAGIASRKISLVIPMGVNFGLWAVAVIPAYFIIAQMGLDENGKLTEEQNGVRGDVSPADSASAEEKRRSIEA